MKTSNEINELAAALAVAQGQLKPVEKNSTVKIQTRSGSSFSFRYTTLDKVIESYRQPFADNGLSVIQAPVYDDAGMRLVTRLCHASGQWIEAEMSIQPGDGDIKTLGSVITYLRRYSLAALVGIASDEDADAASEASVTPAKKQAKQQKPKAQNGNTTADPKQKELGRFLSVTQIELGLEDDDTRTILSDLGEKLTVGRVDELIEIFRGQMENPTCDHALLVVVNRETASKEKPGGYYDNAYHLKNGIAKYLAQNDGSFDWPPKTADDWADARAVAVQYAMDQMAHAEQATQEPLIKSPEPKEAVQYE